jgi:hypothetical protein
MTELQVFSYEGRAVRTVQRSGEPWWVLKDICDVLQLSNPSMIADRLDDDEKAKVEPKQYLGSRSNEPVTIISESGLYNVILLSRKPEAIIKSIGGSGMRAVRLARRIFRSTASRGSICGMNNSFGFCRLCQSRLRHRTWARSVGPEFAAK